jgi:hypothetical protein
VTAGSGFAPPADRGSIARRLDARNVADYLRQRGWQGLAAHPRVRVLAEGPSSVVLGVAAPGRTLVLKQALPASGLDRSRVVAEAECMRVLGRLLPAGTVPAVHFVDSDNFVCGMSSAPSNRTWGDDLFAGRIDPETAARVGSLLAQMQARAASDGALSVRFSNQDGLVHGRLDPCHWTIARRPPDLAPLIEADVGRLLGSRTTLVTGDCTPENVLVWDDGVQLVDFDLVHWGDPALDPAWCLANLMMRALHRPADAEAILAAAAGFWEAYSSGVPAAWADDLEQSVANEIGCLLLALADGRERPAYLTEEQGGAAARALGRGLLVARCATPEEALACARALARQLRRGGR